MRSSMLNTSKQMEVTTNPPCRTERRIILCGILLTAAVLSVGVLSIWAFTHGIEPRPVAGADRPGLVRGVAVGCIAGWSYLLTLLFRGMSKRRLSTGWCPICLAGAFAIIFLLLGCFGKWAGV